MAEGDFPKSDGDIYFASEANDAYNYPLVLLSTTTATGQTFTPTKSDSRIVIWVKGQWNTSSNAATVESCTIDLDIDSVTKDTLSLSDFQGSGITSVDAQAWSLMWSDTDLAASSTDLDITFTGTNGGSISNVKIIVMEYTKE